MITLCDLTFQCYGKERGVKRGGRVRPQVEPRWDGTHYSTDTKRTTFMGYSKLIISFRFISWEKAGETACSLKC